MSDDVRKCVVISNILNGLHIQFFVSNPPYVCNFARGDLLFKTSFVNGPAHGKVHKFQEITLLFHMLHFPNVTLIFDVYLHCNMCIHFYKIKGKNYVGSNGLNIKMALAIESMSTTEIVSTRHSHSLGL